MGNKLTCPGCDAHTSEAYRAFHHGEPCPYCGLGFGAWSEIRQIRERHAESQLRERTEALLVGYGRLQGKYDRLAAALVSAGEAFNEVSAILTED